MIGIQSNTDPKFRAIARKHGQLERAIGILQDVMEGRENEPFFMGQIPWDVEVAENRVMKLSIELQHLREDAGITGDVRLISQS